MTEVALTYVLCLQIVLAFFCPPFTMGERAVFLADLFIFLWTPIFAILTLRRMNSNAQKRFVGTLLILFAVFAIAFLHGMTRPVLPPDFTISVVSSKDPKFQFTKEFVIAFRFFTWATAAMVVASFSPDRVKIQRTLGACAATSCLIMILAWALPDFRSQLGAVYGYDLYATPWPERIYGVFRSPIEGCVALSFSFLLLLQGNWARTTYRLSILLLILGGIYLSKTLTAFIALVLAVGIPFALLRWTKKRGILLLSVTLVGFVFLFSIRNTAFFQFKYGNLLFRLKPWSVYWEIATSRLDFFLFGIGFQPHFSDNIYLFFFGRGGVLLLGGLLVGVGYWWKENHGRFHPLQKAIPLFFVISGMAVDSLIIRPVAYILISAGVVILYDRELNRLNKNSKF